MAIQIQMRRGTAAEWTSNNPTMANGEFGWEEDTSKLKIGDGTTAWTSLDYFGGGDGAPTDASYVTMTSDAELTAQRILTAGSGISITDGGANSTVTIAATGGGGGMTSFDVDGDSGSTQTVTDGNTLTLAGGNGLDSVASATDTVTFAIDDSIAQTVAITADGGTASGDATVDIDNHPTANALGLVAGDNVTITGADPFGTVKIAAASGSGGSWVAEDDEGTEITIEPGSGSGYNGLMILGHTYLKTIVTGDPSSGDRPYVLLSLSATGTADSTTFLRGDDTWAVPSGGGGGTMSSFTFNGDTGVTQTIEDGDELLVLGGNGIETEGSATDTVTVEIDDSIPQDVELTEDGGTTIGQTTVTIENNATANTLGLVAGDNITLTGTDSAGTIKIESGGGGVTSVATSNGTFVDVTGGTITSTGTITGDLSATGTPGASTWLRGDNSWAVIGSDESPWQEDGDDIYFDGGDVAIGVTTPVSKLTIEGAATLKEQTEADADTAGYGQIWIKNDNPCTIWFTDDAGTDTQLGTGGGAMTATQITSGTSSTFTENGTDQLIGMDDYDPGDNYRLTIPRPGSVPAGRRFQFWLANESSWYFAVQTSDSSDLFQTSYDLYNSYGAFQYLETYLSSAVIFTIYSDGLATWYSDGAAYSGAWYGTDSPS